jgi:DNA-binding response OmpR family regulator
METRKRRILLVDDEETFTYALRFYLEKTGRFTVLTENRAGNALAAAQAFHPDIILLDVIMPELDGGAVAAQIQATEELSRVDTPSGLIGGRLFIPKPVSAKEVLAHLDFYLEKGGPAGSGSGGLPAT